MRFVHTKRALAIALAISCFPKVINPLNGHAEEVTMYWAENYLCPIVLLFHKRTLVGVRADLDGSGHGGIGHIGCRR